MDILRRTRWWWWVGVLWIAAYVAVVTSLSGGSPMRRAIVGLDFVPRVAALLPLLVGVAWLVVVAPRIEAKNTRFTERWTGRAKSRLCRLFAWAPLVIFGVVGIQYAAVKLLGIDDFGWFDFGYGWWLLGALVLSVFYGRTMSRAIDRRIRVAAARAERCYACNYRLTGIAAARCPECGEPVSAVPA